MRIGWELVFNKMRSTVYNDRSQSLREAALPCPRNTDPDTVSGVRFGHTGKRLSLIQVGLRYRCFS